MFDKDPLSRRQRCLSFLHSLLTSPKKLIKLLVLLVCTVVVVFQLIECFSKVRHPPITTHSRFELNSTMSYPALTFCREPAYNNTVLKKYGLSLHPRYTSEWKHFPFDKISLEEVFRETTYARKDYFVQYGLGPPSYPPKVDIVSSIHFTMGQCQTVVPKFTSEGTWKEAGYSLLLHHNLAGPTRGVIPGWHLFIHDVRENFAEKNMETSGRVEYMYINVNEDIEIKLTAQHFKKLMCKNNKCTNDDAQSAVQCEERCFWRQLLEITKCRGPWIDLPYVPLCNNYTSMLLLIQKYNNITFFNKTDCECYEPCNSVIYTTSVMNRREFVNQPKPSSQIWLYYTTKMVTVVEERANYDTTQFIADIGGSLGFLLGLSVLGFIGILEKVIMLFVSASTWKSNKNVTNDVESEESSTKPVSDQSIIIDAKTTQKPNVF